MKRIRSFIKFILKWIILPLVFLVISILAFSYYFFQEWYKSITQEEKNTIFGSSDQSQFILTDSGSNRRTGNTFMSIPEWYIVTISNDYTKWMEAGKNPSDFPYFTYLSSYWKIYGRITALMDGNFPRDYEYHTMVQVIGVSTTLEFGLKWLYEKSVWRLTSFSTYQTEEDIFYAKSSRKYVDFILYKPWYLFDYSKELETFTLWDVSIRSVERYLFYWFEFFMKKHYAKIIENATRNTFAVPDNWTFVAWVFSTGVTLDPTLTKTGTWWLSILRYYPFTQEFPKLASSFGTTVQSIAGNTSITIEILGKDDDRVLSGAYITIPDIIQPGNSRYFLYIPVDNISKYLSWYQIEHIYDF